MVGLWPGSSGLRSGVQDVRWAISISFFDSEVGVSENRGALI